MASARNDTVSTRNDMASTRNDTNWLSQEVMKKDITIRYPDGTIIEIALTHSAGNGPVLGDLLREGVVRREQLPLVSFFLNGKKMHEDQWFSDGDLVEIKKCEPVVDGRAIVFEKLDVAKFSYTLTPRVIPICRGEIGTITDLDTVTGEVTVDFPYGYIVQLPLKKFKYYMRVLAEQKETPMSLRNDSGSSQSLNNIIRLMYISENESSYMTEEGKQQSRQIAANARREKSRRENLEWCAKRGDGVILHCTSPALAGM